MINHIYWALQYIFNYIQLHNIHFSNGNEMQLGCALILSCFTLFMSLFLSPSLANIFFFIKTVKFIAMLHYTYTPIYCIICNEYPHSYHINFTFSHNFIIKISNISTIFRVYVTWDQFSLPLPSAPENISM